MTQVVYVGKRELMYTESIVTRLIRPFVCTYIGVVVQCCLLTTNIEL